MEAALETLPGIGQAAARALIAAGVDTVEQLSAVDPENPPALTGFRGKADWPAWVAAAQAAIAAPAGRDAGEKRSFEVVSPLLLDNRPTPVGGRVELSRAAFAELRAAGVVAGEW